MAPFLVPCEHKLSHDKCKNNSLHSETEMCFMRSKIDHAAVYCIYNRYLKQCLQMRSMMPYTAWFRKK